jgi:hypothetical protein
VFAYPDRAQVNRVLPKNKVYGHTQPSRALRQRFITQVEEIVWRYKLAPATLSLSAHSEVKEIQVFSIALRAAELKEDVLRTLDRAIPSLLFFELNFQGRVRFAAAYKRMSEAAHDKRVVAAYYLTPWRDATVPREPLPVAIDMAGLYEQMLHRHMLSSGLHPRPAETLAETAERGSRVRAQELACQRLEIKARREPQFNRKVEINAELRQARARLEELRQ